MTARIVALADEIRDLLADAPSGTFVLDFAPRRLWLLPMSLEELATLQVVVTPSERTTAIEARTNHRETQTVRICVAQKVGDDAQIDKLCELTQQIEDYLTGKELRVGLQIFRTVDEPSSESVFDAGHFQSEKVFRAEIVMTYVTMVALN